MVRWRIGIATELRTQCLWVRIPLALLSRDVVQRTGTAAKLKPSRLRVRIPPASPENIWVDWTWESKLSVKQSLSMSNVGSIPSRPTGVNMARCDVGICSQPLKLAFTGSIPVRVTPHNHDVVEQVDTRCSERRAIKA